MNLVKKEIYFTKGELEKYQVVETVSKFISKNQIDLFLVKMKMTILMMAGKWSINKHELAPINSLLLSSYFCKNISDFLSILIRLFYSSIQNYLTTLCTLITSPFCRNFKYISTKDKPTQSPLSLYLSLIAEIPNQLLLTKLYKNATRKS